MAGLKKSYVELYQVEKMKRIKIVASLEHGEVFPKWAVWCLFMLSILMIAACVSMIVLKLELKYLIALNFFFIIIVTLFLYVSIKQFILAINIKRWLRDAVELQAKCDVVGKTARGLGSGRLYRIRLLFYYNGKKMVRESGQRDYNGDNDTKRGYRQVFVKLSNQTLYIFYSPTYDQVLIIEPVVAESVLLLLSKGRDN